MTKTHYRIEWSVSWHPKNTEQECLDYINLRYPNAVYGNWVESNPKIEEFKKEVYANPNEADYKAVLCTIIKSGKKSKKSDSAEAFVDEKIF